MVLTESEEMRTGEGALNPGGEGEFVQNVVVMRHGDRIDHLEPLWPKQAARPWDPPLAEDGKIRAWTTGRRLRSGQIGFRIHRVLVSPFLRCRQTACEVVYALCAICEDESSLLSLESSHGVPVDTSAVKVSIEYGLCEIMSSPTIPAEWAPKNGEWFPDISELESLLPAGTIDHSSERVYHQLPNWGEEVSEARRRYERVILALAEKYPNENLLLVTHGEGVGASVASFLEGFEVWEVDFCGFSHLQRKISKDFEPFKLLTADGRNGIRLLSLPERDTL